MLEYGRIDVSEKIGLLVLLRVYYLSLLVPS